MFIFLIVYSGVTQQALLLVGATGVAVVVLGRQYAFALALIRIDDLIAINHSISTTKVHVNEPLFVSVEVELPIPAPVDVLIEISPPVTAATPPEENTIIELPAGSKRTNLEFPVYFDVSGRYSFNSTFVTAKDPFGLFEETIKRDPSISVVVNIRGPGNIHIGGAGRLEGSEFTGARAGTIPSGLEPLEVREYTPGDTLKRIDWNATARLNFPHVREFEAGSDRSVLMVVDHRSPLHDGPQGQTAFEYLRTIALGVLSNARANSEDLNLITIGDDHTKLIKRTRTRGRAYSSIRRHLLSLRTKEPSQQRSLIVKGLQWSPERARQIAVTLSNEESSFANMLRKYSSQTSSQLHLGTHSNLNAGIRAAHERIRRVNQIVVFTGDSNRSEIRRLVDYVDRRNIETYLFLAPNLLFREGTSINTATARRQYLSLESFRRDIDKRANIEAFIVAPGAVYNLIKYGDGTISIGEGEL